MRTDRKLKGSGTNRFKDNPTCPCGKSNRDGKFVSFDGLEGQGKGYCHSCDKTFWDDSESIIDPTMFKEVQINYCAEDIADLKKQFDADLESSFARSLIDIHGEEKAVEVVQKYYLGKYDPLHGSGHIPKVIFWQLDEQMNLRAGKVMAYNEKGKRVGYPTWWRHIQNSDCKMDMCLFGQHLISEQKRPIAIVESEKTACHMDRFNPHYTWLATGGVSNLNDAKLKLLVGYDITLFPDHKQYDRWKEKADKWGFETSRDCEDWFEKGLISEGDDIADYYLNLANSLNAFIVEVDHNWNQEEYEAFKIKSNPEYVSDIRTGRFPYFKKR